MVTAFQWEILMPVKKEKKFMRIVHKICQFYAEIVKFDLISTHHFDTKQLFFFNIGSFHANSPNGPRGPPSDLLANSQLDRCY